MPTKAKDNKKSESTKKTVKKTEKSKKSSTNKITSTSTKSTKSKKKTASNKLTSTSKKIISNLIEYYDLPNRYNQTMVRILFQTPKKLFVYWEISDKDKEDLIKQNGENFFENSTPFLIVKNNTMNYSFEIQINDFANSWYFDVPDSNCEYSVELIRKLDSMPIQIKSSNELEVPNNHILFEQKRKEIFFINVKTNNITSKNVANLQFINHIGVAKPVTLNSFYNKFYDEKDLYGTNNPSSHS